MGNGCSVGVNDTRMQRPAIRKQSQTNEGTQHVAMSDRDAMNENNGLENVTVAKEDYPHLLEAFQLIDEFMALTQSDPKLEDDNYDVKTLQKYGFTSYNSTNHRHIGNYMAQVGMAEVIKVIYEHSLSVLELKSLAHIKNLPQGRLRPVLLKLVLLGTVVWNTSDASLAFGDKVAQSGMLHYFVEDLKTMTLESATDDFEEMDHAFETALSVLQNCSRNPSTRPIIRDLDCVAQLLKFLKIKSDEGKLQTLFTLANLVDETENENLLADDSVFDLLFDILRDAMSDDDHRMLGFSVEELVDGMTGLAKNDTNKEVLMKKGALEILIEVLKNGSHDEKEFAVKCLWELSFLKDNRQILCANEELEKLLKDLKECPHVATAKATERALWMMHMDIRQAAESAKSTPDKSQDAKKDTISGHVMISYQWSDQRMTIQIRDQLRTQGFRVWMDIDNMEGSTLQAMAEAVQDSSAILVCMSERYKLSQNCRSEAEYAFSLEKKIIPLLMERGYKPDGWLGIIKGAKLFFDFSGKYPFEQKANDLQKELGTNGKLVQNIQDVTDGEGPIVPVVQRIVTAAKGPDLNTWTTKDVQNWLTKNQLKINPQLANLRGETLMFLKDLSRRAPEFYFNFLKNDLLLSELELMMKFSRALDKL